MLYLFIGSAVRSVFAKIADEVNGSVEMWP